MMSTSPHHEFLTTDELANLLRVPKATVNFWRHCGSGPKGQRVGKRVIYKRTDIDTWLAKQG